MIFENRYQVDKKVMMDWTNHPLVKSQRRMVKGFQLSWVVLGVFFAGYAVSSIVKGMGAFAVFYLFMAVFCVYRAALRNRVNVNRQFKRFSETQEGAQSWERIIRMADDITVIDGITTMKYQYSQVTGVAGDQDYIALMLGPSLGIRMERQGFTSGSADELEEFIRHQKFLHTEKMVRETVELDGVEYEFATQIRDDEKIRQSFHALTKSTYGFDFENWYQGGWWTSAYQPHVLMDGERVVANVSVNLMVCTVDGKTRHYIQLGTVMTEEGSRGKGLARYLMERVIEEWKDKCDLIYLFANADVLEFYPKFGFDRVQEYDFEMKWEPGQQAVPTVRKLSMDVEKDRQILIRAAEESKTGAGLRVWRGAGLLMFYAGDSMKENIYYIEDLDAVVIAERKEDTCRLYDVFSKEGVSLAAAVSAAAGPDTRNVVFGFAPEMEEEEIAAAPYNNDDDALFVMGEDAHWFGEQKLKFPELTHA